MCQIWIHSLKAFVRCCHHKNKTDKLKWFCQLLWHKPQQPHLRSEPQPEQRRKSRDISVLCPHRKQAEKTSTQVAAVTVGSSFSSVSMSFQHDLDFTRKQTNYPLDFKVITYFHYMCRACWWGWIHVFLSASLPEIHWTVPPSPES